jgi:4-hydroxythreonine-4-phosphate dehydrogenase
MTAPPAIAVTTGEPAGIGPDLCVRLAERAWPARLVLIGDIELLRERARRLGAGVRFAPYAARAPRGASAVEVAHFPLAVEARPGRLDPANAKAVLATLEAAVAGCLAGEFAAMVTGPVQKSIINDAGIAFTGHTEFLAARTGAPHVVMLLVGGTPAQALRVALATTHLPLAMVPAAITRESLTATLRVVAADLTAKFGIARPRIAVCGLNPHAGEGGHLGREEIDVIAPAIASLRASGLDLAGPIPADTAFVPSRAREFDCIVVPRPGAARAQARELRPRRQCHARAADPAHIRRPRHRARSRGRGAKRARRGPRQHVRRPRAGDRAGGKIG